MDRSSLTKERIKVIAACFTLMVLAVLIRSRGLGKWCLAADEFYFGEAVSAILERGVPILHGGHYYLRGVGLTYITAAMSPLFKNWEFMIRLPALVAGVLTVPLFFLLCRTLLGFTASLMCAAVILLSSWHIEFSRFARFYTPFQFAFVGFVYCFLRGYIWNEALPRRIAWILAVASVFVYEGSIFVPLVFMLLFLDWKERNLRANLMIACGVAGLFLLNFMIHQGLVIKIVKLWVAPDPALAIPKLPEGWRGPKAMVGSNHLIYLPNPALLVSILRRSAFSIASYGFMWVVAGWLWGVMIVREYRVRKDLWTIFAVSLMVFLPIIHQYGVAIFAITVLFLWRKDIMIQFLQRKKLWVAYLTGTLLFWTVAMWRLGFAWGAKDQYFHFLLGYPPIKLTILGPFGMNTPIWGIVVLIPLLVAVVHNLWKRKSDLACKFLAIVILAIFALSILKTGWTSTRYSFFLFPLVLLAGYVEMYEIGILISERVGNRLSRLMPYLMLSLPLVAFLFTEDFNLGHVLDTASPEYNFRMGKYDRFSAHWYARVDVESPAQYVNKVYRNGDVVVLDHVVASRYLSVPFINYVAQADYIRFPYHAIELGTREKWTGKRLISTEDDFREMVPKNNKESLWLIAATVPERIGTSFNREGQRPEDIAKKYNLELQRCFSSIDGRVAVWQFRTKIG